MTVFRYVAIGDSFTEGLGDSWPSGEDRGWADLLAVALNDNREEGVEYANLAIRGKKLEPLLSEQLPAALSLTPHLLSINGGGNDMLRPAMSIDRANALLRDAVRAATAAGTTVLLSSGADPTGHLPLGGLVRRRGEALTAALAAWAKSEPGVVFVDNFTDDVLRDRRCWSSDGLHLNTAGHAKVTANCLIGLGAPVPSWLRALATPTAPPLDFGSIQYYREYVLPWIGRRLRGRSSGDDRTGKRPLPRSLPGGSMR